MNSNQFNSSCGTILIVDDIPDNLRVLSIALTEYGYQVRCAKNASMALMGAQNALPDLILLDIKMPDIDGYELCQIIKANPKTCDIPVIFLSAMDDAFDKVKAFAVGGVDYITKPFHVQEVIARVEHQLALQTAKKEISALNAELEQRVQKRTGQLEVVVQKLEREIVQRKSIQQKLQESEQRLEGILNSLEDVVWSANPQTYELFYLNPAAEEIYGRSVAEFFQNPNLRLEVVHAQDLPRLECYQQLLSESGSFRLEYRIWRPNGEIRWLSDRSHLVYDDYGKAIRIDGIIYDITERKKAQEQLVHDALHDALTGLPNRVLFMERVDRALKHSKRNQDYVFAILFIDLDRFKVVNDSLGHAVGDRLLIALARILEECIRINDSVARFGGDEFTVLLDDIKNITDATRIAERLLSKLMFPIDCGSHSIFTGASIGIVFSSGEYEDGADLLRDADIAMYRAKERGKGRYAIFDRQMYTQTLNLLKLENDLRFGLERREFLLYYQPIISLITGKINGFETLIRWQHPERGLILPTEFIPIAEDTGLIVAIGEWLLQESCHQLKNWQLKFPNAASFKISVNFASQQIKEPNLIEKLEQVLSNSGLDGNFLRLEITESMLMDWGEKTIDTLAQIKERKIQLSIDDFGTGYSSLSYLHRFPIDTLKIDRSFVHRMSCDRDNFEIVQTIITLAHALQIDVIAEGVETIEQFDRLKTLGCEFAQGYFFSKPMDCQSAELSIANNLQW
jgi:diguanylate cyclase (GGDEF)-like protein/PAS domain S-box-containing protein